MFRLCLSLLFTGLLVLLCFPQNQPAPGHFALLSEYRLADHIYRQAERLSFQADDDPSEERVTTLFQQAGSGFEKIYPRARQAGYDSLVFFIRLRTAFIHYYLDSLETARKDYRESLQLKQILPEIPDSFLFKPLLFTGSIYYSQNEFDSALNYYKKAEQVNDRYSDPLDESPRLYNRLGVMYYQNGNYRQAKNYFEKAISVLSTGNAEYQEFLVNYKINIASLLVKLEEYQQARTVYESILPNENFRNEIYHNLGIIDLHLGNTAKAIASLRKVEYDHNRKNIDLFYNFGMVFSALGEIDSSRFYIHKALHENARWNGNKKNVPHGLIIKFQADELARNKEYKKAIAMYQQAILQFDIDFNSNNIYQNPVSFKGVFSYINLFNALVAKAETFEKLYEQGKNIVSLQASLNSYQSAYDLADYVERTYDSDEARLFLNKIKYTVHDKPIQVGLQLYELTRKPSYLESTYFFDQRNKASILSLNVRENELRNTTNPANELLKQESSLRSAITRLSIQALQTSDSVASGKINNALRDREIELGKLQEKLNADPVWQQKRSTERIPSIAELQKQLDKNTSLLSFHLAENELLTLLVSRHQFIHHRQSINTDFFLQLDSLKNQLYQFATDKNNENDLTTVLFQQLIAPVANKLEGKKRLIIIPDDELNYLPFEALQDENRHYLVEKFAIQYQYSTALLGEKVPALQNPSTLAFAPFALNGYSDSSGNTLSSLPATRKEVSDLRGKVFLDSAATKMNFLSNANHYNILHLATHATVNNEDPLRSFISFYPSEEGTKLYAPEIYNLQLDSTQLVILSACETGTGQLVKGEGLMSLSRAFAYAGCPDIIASLWQAEDKTTAYLTQRLHDYLEKSLTKDKALQLAKLDLLKSTEIEPRFKNPGYWAHLVFIGQYQPENRHSNWSWIMPGFLFVMALLVYFIFNRKKTGNRQKKNGKN